MRNDWRNKHIKCLLPSSKRRFNSSLFHRTSWLSTKPTALQEPFPHPDRLGIIDMWGMTKHHSYRTENRLEAGKGTNLAEPEYTVSDGIQQQHTQQGYCPPSPFKGRRKKTKVIKIILYGCWFSTSHGVSSNNYSVGQGWKGISCASQMNFEPAVK